MASKKSPQTIEGLDNEIEALRVLIRQATEKQSDNLSLPDLINLLNSVGKNSLDLAHMLKIRSELEKAQNDPGAILRQALLDLEEEWPELKELVKNYPAYEEDAK